MIVLLLTFVAVALLAWGTRWMIRSGIDAGTHEDDCVTTVRRVAGAARVDVVNPSDAPVVVGCGATPLRPVAMAFSSARGDIRPARWSERRRPDRGVPLVLGVVEAHEERTWQIDVPAGAVRLRLVLGADGGRLRVHDHHLTVADGGGGGLSAVPAGSPSVRP